MKSIAIISPKLSHGGSERFSINISKGLSERGYKISLLTGPKEKQEYEMPQNVQRAELLGKTNFLGDIKEIHKYLETNRIDICLAVGIYSNLIAAAANFKLKTKIVLLERNAPKQDRLSWKSRLLRKLLYIRGDAFVFQTPDALSFYSSFIQKKGVVIANPLKEGLPNRGGKANTEIVAVGRLEKQKNYPMLLKAMKIVTEKNSDYILRIFGEGPCRNEVISMIEALDLKDKVILEGFCDNVHEKIVNSDIFVMSSDYEGLPNALMEAMAMGFPVVATDCPCGGPRMLIDNGENGILVPVNNSQALSAAIIKLIQNPLKKEQIGAKARQTMAQYTLKNIMDKWEIFLQNLM